MAWQPSGVWAATLDTLAAAAESGDWADAEAQAVQMDIAEGGGDFYSAYVSARRLAGLGRCQEAVLLFDMLTMSKPYFSLAYEGAFLCLMAMDQTDAAVARLDSLLAILPPGAQRDLVFQVRQQVASADRPVFNVFGSLVPSSNANRQTAESTLGAWSIDPKAQGSAGLLANFGASMTVRLLSGDDFTVSGVATAAVGYTSVSGMLEPRFTLEVPATFKVTETITAGFTPYGTVSLDADGATYGKLGARGVVSVPLSETITATLSAGLGYAAFPRNKQRDGWQYQAGLATTWVVDPQWLLTLSSDLEVNATNNADFATAEISGALRVDHAMDWGLLIGLEGGIGTRVHASPAPLAASGNQIDRFASVLVELSHRDFVIGPFMPQAHYRYAIQESDNVFYKHQAHDVGVGLRARF